MEDNTGKLGWHLQPDSGDHQLMMLTQLLQAIGTMHHIDEMYLWLADKMVHRLQVEVFQIWTTEVSPDNEAALALRATSFRDSSLPEHIPINPQVMKVISLIVREQRNRFIQPVENLFSSYQSKMLKRYGLNYCACCYTFSNAVTFSENGYALAQGKVASTVVIAFAFSSRPHSPHFLETIHRILEQALLIAQRQVWSLTPAFEVSSAGLVSSDQQDPLPPLPELIPVRVRSGDSMRSSNPFTSTAPIPDKRALAFFSAVDGSRNVMEVASLKKLSAKDISVALRVLLQEKRIQLYTRDGQLVDHETIFKVI